MTVPTTLGNDPPESLSIALARSAADPGHAAEIDRHVLLLLRDAPGKDALLGSVDLADFAALGDRLAARLSVAAEADGPARDLAWEYLDLVRRPAILRRIERGDGVRAWAALILALVERSHLTMPTVFRRHAEIYGSKTLFEVPTGYGSRPVTWRQAAARVDALARGLLSLGGGRPPERIAILSDNRLEMAIADLACLSAGIVTIMIPANATEADVGYMLRHAGAAGVIVSNREQLRKVVVHRESLPTLAHVIVMDAPAAAGTDAIPLDTLATRAGDVPLPSLESIRRGLRVDALASVMYTSGTTGMPKGIRFTHRNIVYKRFCRALALPEIGEDDVFLCYLPLFHTFGRFLEMMGCIFWGATYCFLDNPSVEALLAGMRRYRPTVFISVPKKWIQLREAIDRECGGVDVADDGTIADAALRLTGGRLRWGLSAAGHLDSEVFRFFQSQGVELMSGFGMTEATGGITMTPPGGYKDDSLGLPLPGIEIDIDAESELRIRGPYVMDGYLDPPPGEHGVDPDGWLRTGDLMERDEDGHIRLVDRKKEIYKNIKGETIAPQRIENLFREFESVGRVFLVGDHREYNAALIYPNPSSTHVDLAAMIPDERKAHFRSIVASVNTFLAPFERIVDFAIIDRDLDPARGELTPKGTPRRKVVEQNFAEVIRLLYRRTRLAVGGLELVFPNWLFQALGLTAQDLVLGVDGIGLPRGTRLTIRRLQNGVAQIGSCLYTHGPEPVQLGVLLTTPRLWLGNEELVAFTALEPATRERPGRAGETLDWKGRAIPAEGIDGAAREVEAAIARSEHDLMDLHRAAVLLASAPESPALAAVRLLHRVTSAEEGPLTEPARLLLARASASPSLPVRRRAFEALVPTERDNRFAATLRRFLETPGVVLDAATRESLCDRSLSEEKIRAFLEATEEACRGPEVGRGTERRAAALLRFVAAFGAAHPTKYRALRAFLVRVMFHADRDVVRVEAGKALEDLGRGFRGWLGPTVRIAVDPETGQEYRWEDVVVFDEEVPPEDRHRVLGAIRSTAFLREAVFLFSGGYLPRVNDIPPGGVFVRPLDERHGKAAHRITVQTRFQGSYDLVVNVNRSMSEEKIQEEIRSLVLCGESSGRDPLVEDFGGYWPEYGLWSEEFVAGETLERTLRRMSRHTTETERFQHLWPFFAWSALAAHIDFWNRTGRKLEIADPAMSNVIVPTHDYHQGSRIVSVSSVKPFQGLAATFRFFREAFVEAVERQYPVLAGLVSWEFILSSLLEAVGEQEGLRMLREMRRNASDELPAGIAEPLDRFLDYVDQRGFRPLRLYFAIQRYRRWARLSLEATPAARARTLQELAETYGIERMGKEHPEARLRFFRDTVFETAPAALADGLEEIIGKMRRRELHGDALPDAIADLRARLQPDADEDYFLARLSFPYLRPEDEAGFVRTDLGGRHQTEIVVSLEDHDANPFQVRHALTPKEVGRLHRLYLAARLDVRFRPEHLYLVAINERQQIIAGIYYEVDETEHSAHLEKIVVAERYRKKGVADALMKEFFNRLKAQGVKTVTTGFYRPEYFYGYGFSIEKRYAGLVKVLD